MLFLPDNPNYTIKNTLRIYVKLEKFQSTLKWTIVCEELIPIIRKVRHFCSQIFWKRKENLTVNNIPEPVHIMLHNQRTLKFSIRDIVSCLVWLEVFKQCLQPCYLNAWKKCFSKEVYFTSNETKRSSNWYPLTLL